MQEVNADPLTTLDDYDTFAVSFLLIFGDFNRWTWSAADPPTSLPGGVAAPFS